MSKGHVLAVDDCAAMRLLMQVSLESFGYSVQAVDSGWAALEAAREVSFDAIVLDVEMPGLDAWPSVAPFATTRERRRP